MSFVDTRLEHPPHTATSPRNWKARRSTCPSAAWRSSPAGISAGTTQSPHQGHREPEGSAARHASAHWRVVSKDGDCGRSGASCAPLKSAPSMRPRTWLSWRRPRRTPRWMPELRFAAGWTCKKCKTAKRQNCTSANMQTTNYGTSILLMRNANM